MDRSSHDAYGRTENNSTELHSLECTLTGGSCSYSLIMSLKLGRTLADVDFTSTWCLSPYRRKAKSMKTASSPRSVNL